MSDPTPVSEIVIYAPPPTPGLVFSPGGGPDYNPQQPDINDPRYQTPIDPPDVNKFRSTLCYAKARVKASSVDQGHPNAEYVGVVYRESDGGYFTSDFYYAGATSGSMQPALDWLTNNGVAFSNLAGEVHNHTTIDPISDKVNRLPSPVDESSARAQMADNNLPGFLIGIIDPRGIP